MLIIAASSATIIVKIGSLGAGLREQLNSVLSQMHCEAPDWTFEGASIQDGYIRSELRTENRK